MLQITEVLNKNIPNLTAQVVIVEILFLNTENFRQFPLVGNICGRLFLCRRKKTFGLLIHALSLWINDALALHRWGEMGKRQFLLEQHLTNEQLKTKLTISSYNRSTWAYCDKYYQNHIVFMYHNPAWKKIYCLRNKLERVPPTTTSKGYRKTQTRLLLSRHLQKTQRQLVTIFLNWL